MLGLDTIKGKLTEGFNYVSHIKPKTWVKTIACVGIAASCVDMGVSLFVVSTALTIPTVIAGVGAIVANTAPLINAEHAENVSEKEKHAHHREHHRRHRHRHHHHSAKA